MSSIKHLVHGSAFEGVSSPSAPQHKNHTLPEDGKPRTSAICSIPGCTNDVRARVLCSTHYTQWRQEQIDNGVIKVATCKIPGCQEDVWANGMCVRHDRAQRATGNALNAPEPTADHCIYEGCQETELSGRDLCNKHYMRLYRFQNQLNKSVPLDDPKKEQRRQETNARRQAELNQYWHEPKTRRGSYRG